MPLPKHIDSIGIVREGFRTTLTELRLRKAARTARQRWDLICGSPALFIVGRERGKLSCFWRHVYGNARCGRYQGSVVNPDTGCPIYLGERESKEAVHAGGNANPFG